MLRGKQLDEVIEQELQMMLVEVLRNRLFRTKLYITA
jgi:hypothetical protein